MTSKWISKSKLLSTFRPKVQGMEKRLEKELETGD